MKGDVDSPGSTRPQVHASGRVPDAWSVPGDGARRATSELVAEYD